jgi:hypothetical protein
MKNKNDFQKSILATVKHIPRWRRIEAVGDAISVTLQSNLQLVGGCI